MFKICCGCKRKLNSDYFAKNITTKDGLQWYCKSCMKAIKRSCYIKHAKNYIEYSKKRAKENKEKWLAYLKSILYDKCNICDYDKCFKAIDFHHINPKEKENTIAYLLIQPITEKRKEEISKTIPLCANCHRELHAKENL